MHYKIITNGLQMYFSSTLQFIISYTNIVFLICTMRALHTHHLMMYHTFNILYTYFFPIALHFQHLLYVFYLKRTTLSTSRSCTYFISSALPFHHLIHIFLLQGTTLLTSLARISSPWHYTFDISCTYFFSRALHCQHLLHVFYLECTTLSISHARISSDHFSLLHVIDCSLSI